jgi:hypothetical protein
MFGKSNDKIDSIIKHRDLILRRESTIRALNELTVMFGPLPEEGSKGSVFNESNIEGIQC